MFKNNFIGLDPIELYLISNGKILDDKFLIFYKEEYYGNLKQKIRKISGNDLSTMKHSIGSFDSFKLPRVFKLILSVDNIAKVYRLGRNIKSYHIIWCGRRNGQIMDDVLNNTIYPNILNHYINSCMSR